MATPAARPSSDDAASTPMPGQFADPRARLRLAMSVAKLGEWWTDGGDYIHFSSRAADIYGLGARRTVRRSDVDAMIHSPDREPTLRLVAEALEMRRDFDVEYRVHRPDGKVVWVQGRGEAAYDDAGNAIGLLGVVADVTERKRAEEADRLRIEEVEHRAKNLLMVVQALIQLTPFTSRQEFVQSLTGRVSALAQTHSLLVRANWSGVPLEALVRQELVAFQPHGDQQIEGPEIIVSSDAAQPLSMILHELATNAAKYGALARPHGVVRVAWTQAAEGAVTLNWLESGGEGPGPGEDVGFGSQLLERLSAQLGGSVARRWGDDGLTVTLLIGPGRTAAAVTGQRQAQTR